MNAAVIRSRTVKTYTLAVHDGEVRPQPYSMQDRRYRVTHIEVVKADGNVSSVTLGGPVLKKDGTDGQNWAKERMYGRGKWPDWLDSVVGGLA